MLIIDTFKDNIVELVSLYHTDLKKLDKLLNLYNQQNPL